MENSDGQISIPMLFSELVTSALARYPDNIAVVDDKVSVTYQELERAAVVFAHALAALGVKKGDPVLIFTDKSAESIAAIIGIVKAGAIYVPADPKINQDRLDFYIEDLAPICIVGAQVVLDEIQLGGEKLRVSFNGIYERDVGSVNATRLPEIFPEDTAYIIYTSGSTGTPKGVMVSHHSLNAMFVGTSSLTKIDFNSRCLSVLPYHFDGSFVDTFYPLARGAAVFMTKFPPFPQILLEMIQKFRITYLTVVSSSFSILADSLKASNFDISTLEEILTGADVLEPQSVQAWFKYGRSDLKIIYGYGPTEATCMCFANVFDAQNFPLFDGVIPFGVPMVGVNAALLDEAGHVQKAEPGQSGLLLISGAYVTQRYLNRPEETSARYFIDESVRYYNTGDWVRIREDGNFCFLGRKDDEVKISGVRVNLNEVRNYFLQVDGVQEAVAGALEVGALGKSIVAIIEANSPNHTELLSFLKNTIESNMPLSIRPTYVVVTSTVPRLPSQKVDRKTALEKVKDKLLEKPSSYFSFSY